MSIEEIVRLLGLAPHPEGGFYRETYRAPLVLPHEAIAATHGGARAASTAIHFLVPRGSFSALHRIASDEVWHFYAGAPLEIVEISPSGVLHTTRLGNALAEGETPQHVVPAGAWFGSRLAHGTEARGDHALVGCTVAPGFDFADFELAARDALAARFPEHAALVASLTRQAP
jgi:predicted cupin superfamily sugar epimerase